MKYNESNVYYELVNQDEIVLKTYKYFEDAINGAKQLSENTKDLITVRSIKTDITNMFIYKNGHIQN